MKKYQDIATLLLRFSLAAGFLSAVSGRLGFWGSHVGGWKNFLEYTAEVNSFLPNSIIPAVAIIATILETVLGILLFTGFKTRYAASGAAALTLIFALAMICSMGIKEPLDYSVPAFSAGAFLLASMPYYRWSIDEKLIHNK